MPGHRLRIIEAPSAHQPAQPAAARPRWSDVLLGLREARGMTQAGWAALLGYGRATIQRWERGEAVPTADAAEAMVALCREQGLFRRYERGRLRGMTLSADLLRELLGEARLEASPGRSPSDDPCVLPPPAPGRAPSRSAGARPPLPARLSSFLGRERELDEIRELMRATRLLTLTGPGGVGKSSLAIEVARALTDSYPDGVVLVELAPLTDASLVASAVADAFLLREQPGEAIDATLCRSLASRVVLLVLDNCEHLVAECARLVQMLLRACPTLSVLATSREPLRLSGETIYRLPSLSLPPPAPAAEGDLFQYSASRLFVERATAVTPTFVITARNAPAIVEICRRLDGMPLALELAAARVRMLSVEQIAERLDDRFRLLTDGDRLGLPRHQTLRATLEWSHRLLAEPERVLFRRLAVFAGGFDLAAAESVCPDQPLPAADAGTRRRGDAERVAVSVAASPRLPVSASGAGRGEVLDLLGQLVDKSLVVVEDQGTEARYGLLETVRQFARERLEEAGETAAMQQRHHAWYLALAEQAEPALWGPQQGRWLDRLQAEHENVRRALAWSLDNEIAGALRLAGHLGRFWIDRGYLTEGRRWIESALAAPGPRPLRGRVLLQLAIICHNLGDLATMRQALHEAEPILRENGETWHLGQALLWQGSLALDQADREGARRLYEESLAVFANADDRQGSAMALAHLGGYYTLAGDVQLARMRLDDALGRFRETGDLRGIAFSLGLLGNLAMREGDLRRAKELWRESLIVARDIARRPGIVGAISQLGRLAAGEGSHARAVRLLSVAATAWTSEIGRVGFVDSAARDASLAEARAALGEDAFASAAAEGQAMTVEQAIAEALGDEA